MKTFLNFRNNLTMLYKNLPDEELRPVMHMRWLLDHIAALETLIINHNWHDFIAILRARRAFYKWRHDFDADREAIKMNRKLRTIPELLPISVVWQYYVKGKKTFSALTSSPHQTDD